MTDERHEDIIAAWYNVEAENEPSIPLLIQKTMNRASCTRAEVKEALQDAGIMTTRQTILSRHERDYNE